MDEPIYVSRKKYGVPCSVTPGFIDAIFLPYVTVLELGEEEYREAARLLTGYNLKPSDALHLAAMRINGIGLVLSEGRELDRGPGGKEGLATGHAIAVHAHSVLKGRGEPATLMPRG